MSCSALCRIRSLNRRVHEQCFQGNTSREGTEAQSRYCPIPTCSSSELSCSSRLPQNLPKVRANTHQWHHAPVPLGCTAHQQQRGGFGCSWVAKLQQCSAGCIQLAHVQVNTHKTVQNSLQISLCCCTSSSVPLGPLEAITCQT